MGLERLSVSGGTSPAPQGLKAWLSGCVPCVSSFRRRPAALASWPVPHLGSPGLIGLRSACGTTCSCASRLPPLRSL